METGQDECHLRQPLIQQTVIQDAKRKWGHMAFGKLVRASLGMSEERLAVIRFKMEPHSRCVFVYRNTFTHYS